MNDIITGFFEAIEEIVGWLWIAFLLVFFIVGTLILWIFFKEGKGGQWESRF